MTWSCTSRCHHRLRNPQGDEGSSMQIAHRGLRVGRSADPEEREEGRNGWNVPPVHPGKKLGLCGDFFILGLPGENEETIRPPSTSRGTRRPKPFRFPSPTPIPNRALRLCQGQRLHPERRLSDGRTKVATRFAMIEYPDCPATTSWKWCTVSTTSITSGRKPSTVSKAGLQLVGTCKRLYVEAKQFLTRAPPATAR